MKMGKTKMALVLLLTLAIFAYTTAALAANDSWISDAGTYIICNTEQIPYTSSGGAVTSDIGAQTLRSIADKAYSDEITGKTVQLDYSGISDMTALELTLDASQIKAGEDIAFIIATPFGVNIFTIDQISDYFYVKDGKYTITLKRSDFEIDIKKDGKDAILDKLPAMGRIGIEYTPKEKEDTSILVLTDETGRVLPTGAYDNGMVYADIFAPGTYKAGPAELGEPGDIAGHWAEEYINYVVLRGLMNDTDGLFNPDVPITREDFIMALEILSGADVLAFTKSSFKDVHNDTEAMPYIEGAYYNGIVLGIGNGLFAPKAEITREQMAQMMVKYANVIGYVLPETVEYSAFKDEADISGWAYDAVSAIQRTGIIEGRPGNIFDPRGNATRAEASTILTHFVKYVISSHFAEGWSNDNRDLSKRVYYDQNGSRLTGWQTFTYDKYWFDDKGIMASQRWEEIDDKWYYFYEDGRLAVNTQIDNYEVGGDGSRK